MGALDNPVGYGMIVLAVAFGLIWAFLALCDRIREREEPEAGARAVAVGAKKDPWGCGSITQEPSQDAA